MSNPVDLTDKAAFALRFQVLLKEKFNGEVSKLAKVLCLSPQRVQNYLDGKHLPRLRDLCDRCKHAGLDAYALLGVDPPSKEDQAEMNERIPDWAYEDGGKNNGKRPITVTELIEAAQLISPHSFGRTEIEVWDRHGAKVQGAQLILRDGVNLLVVVTAVNIARAQEAVEPVQPTKIPEAPSDRSNQVLEDAKLESCKVIEKTAYICGVDWQHEVGEAPCGLYPTAAICAEAKSCTDECGIVEVKVQLVKWIKEQTL